MIIDKDFDAFKSIIEDEEKSKILLRPPNWFYNLFFLKIRIKRLLLNKIKL